MDSLKLEQIMNLLQKLGTGPKLPNDDSFAEGNFYIKKFVKLGVVNNSIEKDYNCLQIDEIICNVPDCTYTTSITLDYESHYNSLHRFSCSQCKKNLPNAHLLDLHLSEQHDSYFAAQVQAAKKPMFACFLEDCSHSSSTVIERKDHCIKLHKFPNNFRFDKQVHKKAQGKHSNAGKVESDDTAMEVDSSSTTKKTYNFGHSKVKSFKTNKGASKNVEILESNQMVVDLLESLPK